MYKDLIDLRYNNWVPRRKEEKAKTLDEIREDVEREERLEAQQAQQQNNNYRGGRNDYGGNRGGGGGGGGDYRNSRSNQSGGNRSRQPKPQVQTDDDGFTTIIGGAAAGGGGGSKTKSSLAQSVSAPRQQGKTKQKAPAEEKKQSKPAAAVDNKTPSKSAGVEPLSKEKLERRVKGIRGEFMQDPSNIEELMLSMDELSGTPDFGTTFVQLNSDTIVDCKEDERQAIFSILAILVEKNKLTSSDVKAGLVDLIEFIDSYVCDAPKAFEYLGEMLSTMLRVKAMDIPWICEQAEKTKMSSEENPEKIIRALAGAIEANRGKDEVRAAFGGSGATAAEKLLGAKWASVSKDIL
jgi:translation initiation factor 4G